MFIPVETLSQQTTRTDSGAGGLALRSNQSNQKAKNTDFEKIFDKERNKNDQKTQKSKKPQAGNTGSSKSAKHTEPVRTGKKNEIADDQGAVLAAGVMGTDEQEVVIILEGEESVAIPEMRADGEKPEFITENPEAEAQTAEIAEKADAAPITQNADDSETAQFKDVLAAKSEAAPQNKEDVAGEVTARTPELKSETENTSKKSDDNLKDNGNPSHLENGNEKAQVKGPKDNDKTYTDALKAVKDKANDTEDKPAPAVTATNEAVIPLTDGIKPEQFKGIQQMTQQALEQPVKPENLFQAMIDRVETMQNAEKSTMTIQLNPEHLGKVMLEIGVDTAGVHVKINAEDTNVRNSINTQINTLIQSLESKGIAVSEVEVVFAGANFDHFSSAGDGRKGEQGGSNHSSKQGNNTKDSVEYYTTLTDLMDYYLDTGVSSMEFKA